MLFGILYCASNAKRRAESFYELVQMELENQIFTNDWEFQAYFPLMVILATIVVPKHYNLHVDHLNKSNSELSLLTPLLKGHIWKTI